MKCASLVRGQDPRVPGGCGRDQPALGACLLVLVVAVAQPTRPTDLAWRGDTPAGPRRLALAHARTRRRRGAGCRFRKETIAGSAAKGETRRAQSFVTRGLVMHGPSVLASANSLRKGQRFVRPSRKDAGPRSLRPSQSQCAVKLMVKSAAFDSEISTSVLIFVAAGGLSGSLSERR